MCIIPVNMWLKNFKQFRSESLDFRENRPNGLVKNFSKLKPKSLSKQRQQGLEPKEKGVKQLRRLPNHRFVDCPKESRWKLESFLAKLFALFKFYEKPAWK